MTKEQEEIYHETINGLMKKLETRDETIAHLREEISYLKSRVRILEGGRVKNDESND